MAEYTRGCNEVCERNKRKKTDCEFCKVGDEKCGTCKKMFEGMDGCSSHCSAEKCRAYEPVNYCFMCGRKMKGGE